MKAYLETVVITNSTMAGGSITSACSQIILEFENYDKFVMFKDTLDSYEKASGFEVYRTLMPIY